MRKNIKLVLLIIADLFMLSVAKIFALLKMYKSVDIIIKKCEQNTEYIKNEIKGDVE